MKKMLLLLAAMLLATSASAQLVITGVFDGPLPNGVPKGVELVAVADIADLSIYGLGSANNGGGTDGEEFTFPADAVSAGTFIWVAAEDATNGFDTFFGFAPTYIAGGYSMSINGDDAIELFCNGVVVDLFGDINVDGTGEAWEHLDSWAYRVSNTSDNPVFDVNDWFFGGVNMWDDALTNATSDYPMPIGTYTYDPAIPNEMKSWGAVKSLFQ